MVEQTHMDMDEIRAKLDALAKKARAISEQVIVMTQPQPIKALTATARGRRRGRSEGASALRLVANR
ncbi:hypothetical protein FHT86_001739 [Rhizobium sp. BK313]|jgi:hypothetical protein|uniref:hypothetical protein n=1 Tax=Rhizobium sp. BK313 TaxID=2587081 RepID=UPI00105FAC13|nr:hypothetical protein [Rhizobium sp. BK313]MBB3453483.1 hypothetical protein [Rhizobium sp. BK313]